VARIVGAIASSHTPTIGFAYDKQKQDDPVWAPIFEGYRQIQAWLAATKPGALYSVAGAEAANLDWDREPAGRKQ
jgi:gallate dioxygenase